MAKISEDCINGAFDALKNFSKEELEDYVREVFVRAKDFDPLQGARAIDKAASEINDELMKGFFSDATQKAKNVMAFENNAEPIRSGKTDVRGILAGRKTRDSYWRKRNIPDAVRAEYEKVMQRIVGDLSHEEIQHLASGKFDTEICDIIDGKKSADAFSNKIADKLRDYWEYSKTQLILSGAMKSDEFHPKRYFSAIHDQNKIINGSKSLIKVALEKIQSKYNIKENKIQWRNFIKKYLDIDYTFKKTDAADLKGNIDDAEVNKIIDRTFDNISSGKSQIFTRSAIANDREAVEKKSKMFFVWKNLRSQYEYNKEYGKGNLFAMLMGDAQSTSHKVGTAKMWGDNVYAMYNDLRKVQEESNPKGASWWGQTDNFFKGIMKSDRLSENPNASNFLSNLRTMTSMASLPLIALNSVSDIAYVAAFSQRFGHDYFKSYGYHLSHIFDTFPDADRVRIAKLMKSQVDSHLGYLGRWSNENNVSSWLNKISTGFFKINLLDAFDRGNKVGNMTLMAKSLGEHKNTSWEKLPDQTRKYLDRFIDNNEWNLLRKKNNTKLFTTENIDSLSDSELRDHYQGTDKSIPLSELKDDLYRRVYAMFTVNAENTVLSPTDFERAFIFRGTNPGSPLGELTRSFGQFKMYTLAFIDRVLIDGFRNADTTQQKIAWATTLLMGTLPLSYLSMFCNNALMGRSMPDPSKMNVSEREKYLLQLIAPSLGLFSGLLDARNQNSSMVMSFFGSPSLSLVSDAMAAPFALASGNPKKAGKELIKAANHLAPIQTTPLISPWIRQAMGQEAYMEPGQKHYFGR